MEWLALCARVFLLYKSTALKWVSYVHDILCPGVQTTMVHRFQQICEINTHWQGKIDHNIFFMLLKSKTILIQSLLLPKLSSCAFLVALDKFTQERCFQQHFLSAMMTTSLDFTLLFM